jgi:hypothetical protein
MRRIEAPVVDETGQECPAGIRRDQLRAAVGVTETRKVERDDSRNRREATPDPAKRPE